MFATTDESQSHREVGILMRVLIVTSVDVKCTPHQYQSTAGRRAAVIKLTTEMCVLHDDQSSGFLCLMYKINRKTTLYQYAQGSYLLEKREILRHEIRTWLSTIWSTFIECYDISNNQDEMRTPGETFIVHN